MAGEDTVTSNIYVDQFKYISQITVIRNSEIVWQHGLYCCYFCLSLKFLGGQRLYWKYNKTVKIAACSEDFCCEDNFDAVLVIFCSENYGENTSQAVHKIIIDENDYDKGSLCVLLCIATVYNRKSCSLGQGLN